MSAEPPYRIIDRRGSSSWGDRQIQQAVIASPKRAEHSGYDVDQRSLVGYASRRTLLSNGRWLYANVSAVAGCIDEMAMMAAGNLAVQYDGEETVWGDVAEKWLLGNDRIIDIRGTAWSMQKLQRLAVKSVYVDGDIFFLLTEHSGGYPALQVIPAHRVRGDFIDAGTNIATGDSRFAGLRVVDGVILDEYARPVGFRVYDDNSAAIYRDISADDMVHVFLPKYPDQIRGFSALAASVSDWLDVSESRRFELQAQKLAASVAMVEQNETGAPPTDASLLIPQSNATSTAPGNPAVYGQQMLGGETRYFRGMTGSKLEALMFDRPSANQSAFVREMVRDAMNGIGWSIDFSLDGSKLGGAAQRIMIEKINRTLGLIRDELLFPFRRRVDPWRLAKGAKVGAVPSSQKNIFAWRYVGAADLTADARYDAQVMEIELSHGLTSIPIESSKRGNDWKSNIRQNIAAEQFLIDESKKAGVDPNNIRKSATQTTVTIAEMDGQPTQDLNAKP